MEPTPEQAAEGSIIVKVLAAVLERLVKSNNILARSDSGKITKFHALKAPGICIEAYLERIHKYACCSNECFILALIYIDRLIQRNNFLLTELNVHRVVITAILLAAKFFDDAYYNNAYYSRVGGVLVSEMNGLEVDFLFRINFSLHVQLDIFNKYKAELVAHAIHSGLSPTVPSPIVSHQPATPTLPQIAEEIESIINATMTSVQVDNSDMNQMTQQQHYFPMTGGTIQQQQQFAAGSGVGLPQVTPSSSEQQQQQLEYVIAQQQQEFLQQQLLQGVNANNINQQQQLQQQALFMPNVVPSGPIASADVSAPLQELFYHHYQPTSQQQQQREQHENNRLQRSNSMPPAPTQPTSMGSHFVDYPLNLPYHSAPVHSQNLPLPMVNVIEQDQYQLIMNQLFPIQPTLVHHNHSMTVSQAAVAPRPLESQSINNSTSSQHHVMNHTTYASGSSGGTTTTMGTLGSVMAYQ